MVGTRFNASNHNITDLCFVSIPSIVFQEDETILIAAGGVFGALAGMGQTQLGWGGPGATVRALITVVAVSASSLGYFLFKEVIEEPEEVFVEEAEIVVRPVQIRRRK
jgi:hypothetical protein